MERFAGGASNAVYNIVTGDKRCYDLETKRQSVQWVFPFQELPTKVKQSRCFNKKIVTSVFGMAEPYRSDLVPCEFYSFPKTREKLRGKWFTDIKEVYEKAVEAILKYEWPVFLSENLTGPNVTLFTIAPSASTKQSYHYFLITTESSLSLDGPKKKRNLVMPTTISVKHVSCNIRRRSLADHVLMRIPSSINPRPTVMERKVHELLQYTDEEKKEIRKALGLKEDIIESEIQAIIDWFNKQPHLTDAGIEPEIVEGMLIISKGSREKTKRKIEAWYKGKAIYAEIYEGRDMFLEKKFMNWFRIVMISRLHNLERITITQFEDVDPNSFVLMDIIKLAFMELAVVSLAAAQKWTSLTGQTPHSHRIQTSTDFAVAFRSASESSDGSLSSSLPYSPILSDPFLSQLAHSPFIRKSTSRQDAGNVLMILLVLRRPWALIADFRIKYDYILGDRLIIDLNNIGVFSILPKMNPLLLQRASSLFQDAIGQKILGIHILNAPPSVQSIVNLLKQFMKPKIMDRIIIHASVDELYEYVEKDYLPKDYGGKHKSMYELAEEWKSEFKKEEMRKYFNDAAYKKSDENKRPGGKIIDPLAGSFKKLDLD
ncbi:Alpha-tocopherol transfer protein [Eumeta japonica]|uniref:Alpha-tocopherol transfer protein n=1 Tax=Eumeta variegata TaxID=151549 RepID=A0A4C1Z4R6_EUMVA|nr:Alpha-tocopherol transfer protein [Eumeta japonica]